MEQLIVELAPLLVPSVTAAAVYFLTNLAKRAKQVRVSENKKPLLRSLAGLLSFGSVVVLSMMTGQDVELTHIQGLAELLVMTGLGFFGATGVYQVRGK